MDRDYIINELMAYVAVDYLEKMTDEELKEAWFKIFGEVL